MSVTQLNIEVVQFLCAMLGRGPITDNLLQLASTDQLQQLAATTVVSPSQKICLCTFVPQLHNADNKIWRTHCTRFIHGSNIKLKTNTTYNNHTFGSGSLKKLQLRIHLKTKTRHRVCHLQTPNARVEDAHRHRLYTGRTKEMLSFWEVKKKHSSWPYIGLWNAIPSHGKQKLAPAFRPTLVMLYTRALQLPHGSCQHTLLKIPRKSPSYTWPVYVCMSAWFEVGIQATCVVRKMPRPPLFRHHPEGFLDFWKTPQDSSWKASSRKKL